MNRFLSFAATALAMALAFAVVGCNDGGGAGVNPDARGEDGSKDMSSTPEVDGCASELRKKFCGMPDRCPETDAQPGCIPLEQIPDSLRPNYVPPPVDKPACADPLAQCAGGGNGGVVLVDPVPPVLPPPVSKDTSGYVAGPSNPVKPDPVTPDPGKRDPVVPTNNTAVPFTELTKDFSARCDNESARELLTRVGSGAVMVINSLEEFYSVIPCGRELDVLPPVDFATSTLLFAAGRATNGIARIEEYLSRISETEYDLTVALWLNETEVAPVWDVGLVVDKLSPNSTVKLNVKASPSSNMYKKRL